MATRKNAANPFYSVLLIVGIAFALTACAYGVMTVQRMEPGRVTTGSAAGTWVIGFMDDHGATTMTVELVVMAIATLAAIGTDRIRARRTTSCGAGGSVEQSECQQNER